MFSISKKIINSDNNEFIITPTLLETLTPEELYNIDIETFSLTVQAFYKELITHYKESGIINVISVLKTEIYYLENHYNMLRDIPIPEWHKISFLSVFIDKKLNKKYRKLKRWEQYADKI
jgi:hypothetical protein